MADLDTYVQNTPRWVRTEVRIEGARGLNTPRFLYRVGLYSPHQKTMMVSSQKCREEQNIFRSEQFSCNHMGLLLRYPKRITHLHKGGGSVRVSYS